MVGLPCSSNEGKGFIVTNVGSYDCIHGRNALDKLSFVVDEEFIYLVYCRDFSEEEG